MRYSHFDIYKDVLIITFRIRKKDFEFEKTQLRFVCFQIQNLKIILKIKFFYKIDFTI